MDVQPVAQGGNPRVASEVPAGLLLVDVAHGTVVSANRAAGRLAGDVDLPVTVAEWAVAAGLARPDGTAYDVGASPVDRVGRGEPADSEYLTLGPDRRTVAVSGVPLPQTGPADLALLVVLDAGAGWSAAQVRERAVSAAGVSFTISDLRAPDNPLVYVNRTFELTTGYSADEALGRNCRFLQGPATDPAAIGLVRAAIHAREHAVVTLLNYRKDGTSFWNELSMSPVYDGDGRLTHYVGIQSDVTRRVQVEEERGRMLAAEQSARAAAEKAQRRLALLAEATSMLAATLDVDESLTRLADLVVPLMADFCFVELLDDGDQGRRVARAHVDPDQLALLERAQELQPASRTEASPVQRVLATGTPLLLRQVTEQLLREVDAGQALSTTYRELGIRSVIVVPLRARRQVLGTLTLGTAGSGRTYDEDDVSMAADLARRAALTVDNARLYQREHEVAEALQRSLLPTLPDVPGLDRAARYLPGSTAAQVGGDWYDLFSLPDGAVGIAVGDVMGHDLTAAAAMGQLRSVLRSYAWQGSAPAVVLDHLDQLVQGLGMAQLATAIYGRMRLPVAGRPGELRLANAGHLPPVLRGPDGRARLLSGPQSLLVGAALGTERAELTAELPAGSLLVLYTDGLVEKRGLDPDAGLERLRRAVEAVAAEDAETICDHLLAALEVTTMQGPEREDDIALLVVRIR